MMIAIVNYELGNLMSVAGAVERLGYEATITSSQFDLERADRLILPGVGAFADGMKNLKSIGLIEILTDLVKIKKVPILGICLGFQLLAIESCEFGHHQGLGFIDASVIRLDPEDKNLRIPHVGWNDCLASRENIIMDEIPQDALFYYVHSYHVKCADSDIVTGECEYGMRFTAAIRQGNIFATQFHPEKSQLHGLKLLQNFIEKVK